MKLSEITERVIELSEAICQFWDVELPKRHRDYPIVHPEEDSGPPPPEEKELRDLLNSLAEEDIYRLVLVVHLGRGDFGTDDLARQFETLKERFNEPRSLVALLMDKASLAYYLDEGLAELKKGGIYVDDLSFVSVHTGG